jgi:hypothetical protein
VSNTDTVNNQATHSSTSRVVEVDAFIDPRWEAFVTTHPGGLIYHHPAWLRVLKREYGQKFLFLFCEGACGECRGILPLVYTRGLPFGKRGELTGRRLSSLPRTPVAGPLTLDEQATAALLWAAVQRVRERPSIRLQLKASSNQFDGLVEGLVGVPWRQSYTLTLPENPDQLRFGNARSHARIRWAVNRAAKSGVEVRSAETEGELRAWYALYLETMRWHAIPPRSYRFFRACWELLRPRGLMQLLVAEQRVNSQDSPKLLAGSILLKHGQSVFYAFNGRCQKALALRPNDAIQWRAVHDACIEGFRHYDFGEVAEANHGLAKFKEKWGPEASWLYRYYYPAPRASDSQATELGTLLTNGALSRVAYTAWQHLPLQTTALLGRWIYSYL